MRIRQRIFLGFLAVVAIFSMIGVFVYFNVWQTIGREVHSLDKLFQFTVQHSLADLKGSLHLILGLETSRRALHEYLLRETGAEEELLGSLEEFDQSHGLIRRGIEEEIGDWQQAGLAERVTNLED